MFICFGIEQFDILSVVFLSDFGCIDWDFDFEDFIIFDNLFIGEGNCCIRIDFVCGQYEFFKEGEIKFVFQLLRMYCEVLVVELVDIKLDFFI